MDKTKNYEELISDIVNEIFNVIFYDDIEETSKTIEDFESCSSFYNYCEKEAVKIVKYELKDYLIVSGMVNENYYLDKTKNYEELISDIVNEIFNVIFYDDIAETSKTIEDFESCSSFYIYCEKEAVKIVKYELKDYLIVRGTVINK